MGDRTVPFEEDEVCQICGKKGAYDFMGDSLGDECSGLKPEPCNRCGNLPCECDTFME